MDGVFFNIQRFSLHDGPGIRTTVFFKGCPLNCEWCHNPEGKLYSSEVGFAPEKCVGCGACLCCPEKAHGVSQTRRTFRRELCAGCGSCTKACPSDALEIFGKKMSVVEVLGEATRDDAFYKESGGGITLSGGEPMAQPDVAFELARLAYERGVGVCVETCGYCHQEDITRMVPYVQLFLYDFKLSSAETHKQRTGVSNELILSNLRALDSAGAAITLRCTIVPGINDGREHAEAIAELCGSLSNLREVNLQPYHQLGGGKAHRLGLETPDFGELDKGALEALKSWINKLVSVRVTI